MPDVGEKVKRYYRPPMTPPDGYDGPDAINALQTTYDPQGDVTEGWLSTLVWNTRNTYLGMPDATFPAEHMRMVCEGFLAEVARLRGE